MTDATYSTDPEIVRRDKEIGRLRQLLADVQELAVPQGLKPALVDRLEVIRVITASASIRSPASDDAPLET